MLRIALLVALLTLAPASADPIAVAPGDAHAQTVAVALTGDASCSASGCVAVSVLGSATCPAQGCTTAAGTGTASCPIYGCTAISVFGDADACAGSYYPSQCRAVSVLGHAAACSGDSGFGCFALSALGTAESCENPYLRDEQCNAVGGAQIAGNPGGGASALGFTIRPTEDAHGDAWVVSGTGSADCDEDGCIALSGTSDATACEGGQHGCTAASLAGRAEACGEGSVSCTAVSVLGEARACTGGTGGAGGSNCTSVHPEPPDDT